MFKKSVAIMALLAGLSATGAEALSLKKGAQPAEYPPADYKSDTYVDSRGCVYVRAGFAGRTSWVPRVSRDRKVVCGAKPTGGAELPVIADAPKADAPMAEKPAPKATAATLVPAAPAAVAAKPAVKPAKTYPLPKPVRVTSAPKVSRSSKSGASHSGPAIPPRVAFGNADQRNPALPQPSPAPRRWSDRSAARPAPAVNTALIPTVAPVANLADLPGAVAAPKILPDDGKAMRTVRVNCPARSKVSQVYLNGSRLPVRCGPQQIAPVTYVVDDGKGRRTRVVTMPHPSNVARYDEVSALGGADGGALPGTTVSVPQGHGHAPRSYRIVRGRDLDKAALPPETVIAPKTYIASNMPVEMPEGYRAAWSDGRLNPLRGVRTVGGDLQTAEIWSEGTPRRLKEVEVPQAKASGGSLFGGLFGGKVRSGRIDYDPVPVYSTVPDGYHVATRGKTVVATRSAKAKATAGAGGATHRYVQVGGYADPANARKVIRKLQGLGLTVSSVTSKRGVKTILAGPFRKQAALADALKTVRGAGFRDAFLRK